MTQVLNLWCFLTCCVPSSWDCCILGGYITFFSSWSTTIPCGWWAITRRNNVHDYFCQVWLWSSSTIQHIPVQMGKYSKRKMSWPTGWNYAQQQQCQVCFSNGGRKTRHPVGFPNTDIVMVQKLYKKTVLIDAAIKEAVLSKRQNRRDLQKYKGWKRRLKKAN